MGGRRDDRTGGVLDIEKETLKPPAEAGGFNPPRVRQSRLRRLEVLRDPLDILADQEQDRRLGNDEVLLPLELDLDRGAPEVEERHPGGGPALPEGH